MDYSKAIKNRIKKNALAYSEKMNYQGKERESAYIFDDVNNNFLGKTYKSIQNQDSWRLKLKKPHSQFNDGTLEMQSSNSSDALLMNIFCFPNFFTWKGPTQLLGIDQKDTVEFGWNPKFNNETPENPTEIDLKIGNSIFEANLTEKSFTKKRVEVVKMYQDFDIVFNEDILLDGEGNINHYQLVRNILTAHKYELKFSVLLDSSRIDLIKALLETVKAIKIPELRRKVDFITWQELVDVCGKELKEYISSRYF